MAAASVRFAYRTSSVSLRVAIPLNRDHGAYIDSSVTNQSRTHDGL